MAVTRLGTYIETLFTDIGYISTIVSNGCDKNWIRELVKMSQTLLMFSLMLQPLLIQYVSNGCDKIAVTFLSTRACKVHYIQWVKQEKTSFHFKTIWDLIYWLFKFRLWSNMEALRYIPSSSSFSIESMEIPSIQNADDVLIEVRFAGLCGTDIHIQQVQIDKCALLRKMASACAVCHFTFNEFI